MKAMLVGIALGAAASTISFVIGGFFAQEDEVQPRTAIIFYDETKPVEYYETAPDYEENVAAIGEQL